MKVRLLVPWNGNEAGKVLTLNDGPALVLIETGKAVAVSVPESQKVQPAEIKKAKR